MPAAPTFADPVAPMWWLGDEVVCLPELRAELVTARDYATFVRRRHDETFIYASRFRGAFVPVFDGLVLGPDGQPRRNVSLKFDSLRRSNLTGDATMTGLIKSLRTRLDQERDRRRASLLARWLTAVNAWPPASRGWQEVRELDRDIDRALILWATFGLSEEGFDRPLQTVVDVRDGGFAHDVVARPENVLALGDIAAPGSLGLLWDQTRVLEF